MLTILLNVVGPLIGLFTKLFGFWMAYRQGKTDKKIADLEAENEILKDWERVKPLSRDEAYKFFKKKGTPKK